MAKYIFLIRPPDQVDLKALKSQVLDKLVPRLLQLDPEKLKVELTEPRKPLGNGSPSGEEPPGDDIRLGPPS
jgi:hypothetical protein